MGIGEGVFHFICRFKIQIKSNLLSYSSYYIIVVNKLEGPTFVILRQENAASWRVVAVKVTGGLFKFRPPIFSTFKINKLKIL